MHQRWILQRSLQAGMSKAPFWNNWGMRSYETIVGISSMHPSWIGYPTGVTVIRMSGQKVKQIMDTMCKGGMGYMEPRRMYVKKLFGPDYIINGKSSENWNKVLDHQAMVVYFPKPHSVTGEDVLEFHVHGSPAIVSAVVDAIRTLKNVRIAKAGEFTKRAFLSGRMDLTQVEGLADLLHAETEAQRIQAIEAAQGLGGRMCEHWRTQIIRILASFEAVIDFGEEDIEDSQDVIDQSHSKIVALAQELEGHLLSAPRAALVRQGVKVALIGAPNVGKSTLMNLLCQENAAIVSPSPGTTRDLIKQSIDLEGNKVLLIDGAGLRKDVKDEIEIEGIKRMLHEMKDADVILRLWTVNEVKNDAAFFSKERMNGSLRASNGPLVINAVNKIDLSSYHRVQRHEDVVYISCLTGEGIPKLTRLLSDRVNSLFQSKNRFDSDFMHDFNRLRSRTLFRPRHLDHIKKTVECLHVVLRGIERRNNFPIEIAAEYLRNAVFHLSNITRPVHTEDILDTLFDEFCIGK